MNPKTKMEAYFGSWTGNPFRFVYWDGTQATYGRGEPGFTVHFRTKDSAVHTVLTASLGLGEGYASGEIAVDGDLETVLVTFAPIYNVLDGGERRLERLLQKFLARTLAREKHDIEHHYGRGDEFYRYYLDKKLQYSCAYFRTPADSLDLAQEQKIAYTGRKLHLQPGQRLLDIGCGWGHLMFHAAEQYGVSCLGITLCDNQAAYIREQARERCLPIEVRVMNYLELDEQRKWDRIVSVGMMCHIGEANVPAFFDKVKSLLSPEAIVLLHCIAHMQHQSGSDPFVQKYVFPGYWFNSLQQMVQFSVQRGLNILDIENLRRHYALTAHHWRRNFLRNWNDIQQALHCDDRFMRIWEFYLALVVTGFRTGTMNLIQMTMSNGITDGYPWTRDFLYAGDAAVNSETVPRPTAAATQFLEAVAAVQL